MGKCNYLLPFLFFLFQPLSAFNQQRCAVDHELKEKPAIAEWEQEMEVSIQEWIAGNKDMLRFRDAVVIPVVVHIVWKEASDNISDASIQSQIDVINQDFRLLNNYLEIIAFPPFLQVITDMEIEFCLAQRDPQGNSTSGITRTQTSVENVGSAVINGRPAICYSAEGGRDAWDPERYLNIWVGRREFACGKGTFPGEGPPEEDGIRVSPACFGVMGEALPPYHLGRTATHEIGHYLNLKHLWGSGIDNPGCIDDDEVADTPKQAWTYQGECPFTNQISCGTVDMFMNFMNYTDDACMAMFTQGQKMRAWATLQLFRSGLLDSDGCLTVDSEDSPVAPPRVELLGNPTRDWIRLQIENVRFPVEVELFNSAGQLMRRVTLSSSFNNGIEVNNFPSGIYFLKLTSEEFQSILRVFVAP
jgi:hypothetical protein